MDIMVEGPQSSQVAGMLHEREIPYAIAIGDLSAMIEKEQDVYKKAKHNSDRGK